MGTWGTGILDNDLAEDLKSQWNEYLREGYTPEDVSDHMIETFAEEGMMEDIEDQYDFFIPFALIQWKSGRLQDKVKERALKFLQEDHLNSIEKSRWHEPGDLKKRFDHLQMLHTALLSQQPKTTRITKSYLQTTTLKQGDLFSILLNSGNYVLLEVIEIVNDRGAQVPICFLYKYKSRLQPTSELADILEKVEFDYKGAMHRGRKYSRISLISTNKKSREPSDRIIIIQKSRNQENTIKIAEKICLWSEIDSVFEKWLETAGS